MPIIDLVSPWALAEQAGAHDAFQARWRALLEPIRRQRAPTEAELPAPHEWGGLAAFAADGALHLALRETRDRLVDRGLVNPTRIVLIASAAPGAPFEVIPEPGNSTIALFVDRAGTRRLRPESGDAASLAARPILAALAAGMAHLTRWTTPGNPIAIRAAAGPWDRWDAARDIPLAEWIYAAGLGVHAAELVGDGPATALGLSDSEMRRLRRAEHSLQERLDAELDRTGMGLMMRWLEDDAPLAMRRAPDGTVTPNGAGRYLGWRMLAERVARVGVAEAAAMEA